MVKDSSKKLNDTKAEKVKEVIVKKVEEIKPEILAPEPTIKKESSKMPKEIKKPKQVKRVKKLIKTGKEGEADFIDEVAESQLKGSSTGMYIGIAIGVLIASAGIYFVYSKLKDKVKPKKKDVETIETKDIKSLTEVKKVDTK